jgi:hypothetical protein
MPIATLRVDGKLVGKTPMVLQYPKSTRQITIEATMKEHIYTGGGKPVGEPFTRRQTVTLDRDQLIDFSRKK